MSRRSSVVSWLLVLVGATASACGGGGAARDVVTGFVTADTRVGGGAPPPGVPLPEGPLAGDADLGAPAASAEEGVAEVAREIEEADVYAVTGDVLVLLNVHRGLAVVDLAAADRAVVDRAGPTVRGRLPLEGMPRDLHVAGDDALAVLGSFGGGTSVVDVSLVDPAAPAERARRSLPGPPLLSRRLGSVLYVVTGAAVATFSTDGLLTPLDEVALPEGGAVAHASPTCFAVAGWFDGAATSVRLVDVSSPTGALALRGRVDVAGWVADEFKLDVAGSVLRVVAHDAVDGGLSRLTTWSLADPDAPAALGALALARGEQLFATRFDGARAYVVTFLRVDPLWVLDLSDPADPRIAGELTVPGWSTHLVPLGSRLVAVGVEPTPSWSVVASLFDVSDPAAPALRDRVDFGAGWSEAFHDVRALGVFPDDGLVTVPVSGAEERVAVLDLGAATLDLRGDVAVAGAALRGFPHARGLVCLSTEEVVVADLATLADRGRATLAENVVDVVRTSDGVARALISRGAGGRLDGVDLSLAPQRAFAAGTAVAVVGSDEQGSAAYVVRFDGPVPTVSARFALGAGWQVVGPPSAGMALPDTLGWAPTEIALTPAGRLVVHAAPPGASDGFAVIDVPGAALEAPVALAEGFVTGFALDGEALAYTRALPVAADERGRPRLRHTLVRLDLPTRGASAPTTVPGWLLALEGDLAFTAEEVWDAGWSWSCSVVAVRLGAGEPTVLDRLALPAGAFDLRAAGRTLFFTRLEPGGVPGEPPGGDALRPDAAVGIAPGFGAGLGTLRLGASLAFGPSIDAAEAFRTLLLAQDGAALVVRDGVHLERWDVSGATAQREFDLVVPGWPLAAHPEPVAGTYLLALGYGGWMQVP